MLEPLELMRLSLDLVLEYVDANDEEHVQEGLKVSAVYALASIAESLAILATEPARKIKRDAGQPREVVRPDPTQVRS